MFAKYSSGVGLMVGAGILGLANWASDFSTSAEYLLGITAMLFAAIGGIMLIMRGIKKT